MEYTILILLLPFLSFLALGIGGKWMSHRTAGTIGTLVLAAVTVLSYVTAVHYFSAPRLADGTFATLIPYFSMVFALFIYQHTKVLQTLKESVFLTQKGYHSCGSFIFWIKKVTPKVIMTFGVGNYASSIKYRRSWSFRSTNLTS